MGTNSSYPAPHEPPGVDPTSTVDHGPFFILINVSSGSRGERREALVESSFQEAGAVANLIPFRSSSHLSEIVRRTAERALEEGGTMVVAGGDGTINSSLPSLLEYELPLGILPSGTFNYVAREFGIPLDLKEAVKALVTGRIIEVPVGQVNTRPFLVNASLGLYPSLLEDRERAKRKYGRNRPLALTSSMISLVTRRAQKFELEVQRGSAEDGPLGAPHELEIATLFIGNNALQLKRLGFEPSASQNELTAIALRTPTPLRLLELGTRAAFGSLANAKDILSFPFETLTARVRNTYRKGVKVALDGEIMRLHSPLTIRSSPRKLRLIVPSDRPEPSEH